MNWTNQTPQSRVLHPDAFPVPSQTGQQKNFGTCIDLRHPSSPMPANPAFGFVPFRITCFCKAR